MFITTEVNNPVFAPEVAVFANFISFAVTQGGLEAQLLSVIVGQRMAGLEQKFSAMKVKALDCIKRMKASEELILKGLSRDIEVVLKDETLVQNLAESNKVARKCVMVFLLTGLIFPVYCEIDCQVLRNCSTI